MSDFSQWAMNLIARNPNIANNPRNKELFSIIQNGDSTRGEEVARNFCKTYGVSEEDAVARAREFFHI